MTIPQFKKWLKEKIAYADNVEQFGHQTDFMDDLVKQAREYAVDLGLPEAAAACRKGPATVRLMEVLNAIPEPESDTLTPPEIAEQLSVSNDTVLGWIRSRELKASNIAARTSTRPRWVVRKADLETFLKNRQPEPSKRATKIESSFKRYST